MCIKKLSFMLIRRYIFFMNWIFTSKILTTNNVIIFEMIYKTMQAMQYNKLNLFNK